MKSCPDRRRLLLLAGILALFAVCGVMAASGNLDAALATAAVPVLGSVFAPPNPVDDRVKVTAAGIANSFGRTTKGNKTVDVCGALVLAAIGNRDPDLAKYIKDELGERTGEDRENAFVNVPGIRTLRALDPVCAVKVGKRNSEVAELLTRFDEAEKNPPATTAVTTSGAGSGKGTPAK